MISMELQKPSLPLRKYPLVEVVICIALWVAVFLCVRSFMLSDGEHYSEAAGEASESGDGGDSQSEGLHFFHKPPMFYWSSNVRLFARL